MANNFGGFAKQLGTDIKAINATMATKTTQQQVQEQIANATRGIASSDTINAIQGRIDAIEAVDLLSEYNKAKGV